MRLGSWSNLNKEKLSVKETIKSIGKSFLGRLCIYKIAQRPIFIFSTRRGGSTLLMNMIYSQPGVDYINQPLDLWQYHPHFDRLPHPRLSKFITLEKIEEQLLRNFFNDLLSGQIRLRNQWNVCDPCFNFYVDRLTIKICNAHDLIEWFAENFEIDIIYLIRHPIPVSLSIIKREWRNAAFAYLENTRFREDHLDSAIQRFARDLLAHGTTLQKYVLEWCLENLYPMKVFRQQGWLTLAYEEVILRPGKVSELICSLFDLPDLEPMRNTILSPSRTTLPDSKHLIQAKGPSHLVKRWLKQVDLKDIGNIDKVLEAFGVEIYKASSPYPASELCHFGSLDEKAK